VESSLDALAARVALGEKRAVARALDLAEDRRPAARADIAALLSALAAAGGHDAHRVGITGPPGAGKSTLVAALARVLRARGRTVGVLAVDPSSVRSGGALLGDRARMGFDPADDGLFVRSAATGGEAGGLNFAAHALVAVLAAAYDVVLVETTGVGQTETDVERVVDTVALVVQPGSGDTLQFLKAGVMEIPDVLVVNKADEVALAARAEADLRTALGSLRGAGIAPSHEVAVLRTSARDRTGLDALADALDAHRTALGAEGLAARRLEGTVASAVALFVRRHGERGLERLGGVSAVRRRAAEEARRGLPDVAVAVALGAPLEG
jgi:LAO/AO transport system kinase